MTRNFLAYRAWGFVSTLAIRAYYAAPREMLQDELFAIHRYALKRAHDARMRDERHADES